LEEAAVETETIIGLGSAALALLSAVLSGVMANRSARLAHELDRRKKEEDAAVEAERILQQYRDPLLDAAHTLQGRLFNIMAQGFLDKAYGEHVDEYERRYARDYTVFAIAEYLCWVEILRRELRFRDLGNVTRNQALLGHLTEIQYAFQRDDIPAQFRVFRGRQRAIAELMMVPTNASEGPRSECIGYAAFSRRLETDHDFRPWMVPLGEDVAVVAGATAYENRRLVMVQQQLIDLIDFLDPKKVRIPAQFRQRLTDPLPMPVPTQPTPQPR
jgi:hypothetical protein